MWRGLVAFNVGVAEQNTGARGVIPGKYGPVKGPTVAVEWILGGGQECLSLRVTVECAIIPRQVVQFVLRTVGDARIRSTPQNLKSGMVVKK